MDSKLFAADEAVALPRRQRDETNAEWRQRYLQAVRKTGWKADEAIVRPLPSPVLWAKRTTVRTLRVILGK